MASNGKNTSVDDKVYNNSIDFLNNKESDYNPLLANLDNLVDDLIKSYDTEEKFFIENNSQFGTLNATLILNQGNQEDLIKFFEALCIVKDVSEEDYAVMQHLFKFIIGNLINIRNSLKREVKWIDFVQLLESDLSHIIYTSQQQSVENVKKHFTSYLKQLPNFDSNDNSQSIATIQAHTHYVHKIKNVFYFKSEKEVLDNPIIMETIEQIMNKTTLDKKSDIKQYILDLYYEGVSNEYNNNHIDSILLDFTKTEGYMTTGYIVYNLIDSLIKSDKASFFAAVEDYASFYWKNEVFDNEGNSDTIPYSATNLNLNHKVSLFFSDYFNIIQLHGEPVSHRFIDLLFSHYNKDIFESFMEYYQIPYNIAIRVEEIEEPVTSLEEEPKIIKSVAYYSLFEYAFTSGLYEIAKDIYAHKQSVQPFYLQLIEDHEVHEYSTQDLFNNYDYDEEDLLFLIEEGILNKDSQLPMIINGEDSTTDPFYYFIAHSYNQAFAKLYYVSKEKHPEFSLKDYQQAFGLFGIYLNYLYRDGAKYFNPLLIEIFYNEGYSLTEKNSENISCIDIIKEFEVDVGIHLVAMLEPLFEVEHSQYSKPKTSTAITVAPTAQTAGDMMWFDREALAEHLKNISKDKENSNIELIKTMLTNNNHLRRKLVLDNYDGFDILQERFPNFKEVIQFYKSQFKLKKLSGKNYIPPILLLGEPGIGKTLFAKELAQFLNTGYTFLDMGSLTAGWILSGNNGSWKSAKQGKILDAMLKSKTANPLILIDEIDKARSNQYDPTLVLYQLLEVVNAKEFTDEFIDFAFDASGIIYIACANSLKSMTDPLVSRFKTFNIERPTSEQMGAIIQNIYAEGIKDTKIFAPELDNELVEVLKGYSLRSIRVVVDDAISNALLELSEEEIQKLQDNNEMISLQKSNFKDPSKKTPVGF